MNSSASPCPLCAGHKQIDFLEVNSYRIVRCVTCGFLFVSPSPTSQQLQSFYQQGEYYTGGTLGYSNYMGERRLHERLALRRLRTIERLCPGRGRLLDVGCAAGFFLHVAQQRGWEPFGVELSNEMVSYATQLIGRPIAGSLSELQAAPHSFDAITLWEYIEHIPDPNDEIERLTALLRPGGILALSTPNTGYWTAVHQPQQWREYKPPAHLGFFTDRSLRQMLEGCGLDVLTLKHTTARAPSQPYALFRLLQLLRERAGNREQRITSLWWSFSLAWRLVERISQLGYQVRWPGSDLCIGLEAYARKR